MYDFGRVLILDNEWYTKVQHVIGVSDFLNVAYLKPSPCHKYNCQICVFCKTAITDRKYKHSVLQLSE